MIGIYAHNQNTLTQFLELFQDLQVESYTSSKTYDAVVWLSDKKPPQRIPVLQTDDSLPLTLSKWRLLLQKQQTQSLTYHNSFFNFDAISRTLTNIKTKQIIALTEKETALLIFLVQAPNHQASKDQILQQVWQYNPDTETHTLESHFYVLKQKLGKDTDKIIRFQNSIFYLI